jgi:S-formylglutathione hydrolase FrmB
VRLAPSVLLLALLTASTAHPVCDPPRCRDVAVPVPRRVQVPERTVRVLLPEGYDDSRRRYPVFYLLHGAGDTFATWTENTDVQEFSTSLPVIIVMPDGGRNAEAGFYSDWLDGSRQWETFHTRVLRKFVDRRFRTLRGRRHRAVGGLSMGGFGALSYAARHPGLFRAAASFSGALDPLYPSAEMPTLRFILSPGAWGDPVADAEVWRDHSLTDRAADLEGVALFLATGDGTRGGPAGDVENPFAYATEVVVAAMTRSFAAALDAAGVPHTDDFYGAGYHGWPYWQRELHWALPQIVALIGPRRRALSRVVCAGAQRRAAARAAARLRDQSVGPPASTNAPLGEHGVA